MLLFLSLFGMIAKSQVTYQLNYLEVYENNKIISKGEIDNDKLVINEIEKRISIIPQGEYKTQIFKIVSKAKHEDEITYSCEMMNPNGLVQVELVLNTFYKFLKCTGEGDIGNYIKYYFK